jgi:hypothetical protein
MRKVIVLSVLLLFVSTLGAFARNVNITVKNRHYRVWEVGVELAPRLELVGLYSAEGSTSDSNSYDNHSDWYFYPGFGARYTFWEQNSISTYAFGSYVLELERENGKFIGRNRNSLKFGLGGCYELSENFALIGEMNVERDYFYYEYDHETGFDYGTDTNFGLRFKF